MSAPETVSPPKFPYLAMVTVAVATFMSVTIEMLPTGLLPDMSEELGVSESLIGLTVSVFAFTVVLTSAVLSHLTRRFSRHALVVTVLLILAVSAVLTAVAPNYELLVASRIMGGLAHGLFWAVVGAYPAYLVPPQQIAKAVAIALGGGTLAFVFGVPIGVALGHALGWRLAFGVVAAITVLGALIVYRFLPKVDHNAPHPVTEPVAVVSFGTGAIPTVVNASRAPRREQSALAVVLVCCITAITMVGQYTFYTYVAPFLERGMGLDRDLISPALFVYGAMGVVAVLIVTLWLGARPRLGLNLALAGLLVALIVLAIWPQVFWLAAAAFILWGLAIGMLPTFLQTRVLHAAPARIRDLSSAFYTTAFNIGIGGGALVGAIALELWGLGSLAPIAVGCIALSIVAVMVSDVLLRGIRPRRVIEH